MIQVLAGSVELHSFVTDYKIEVTPIESENSFTAHDGSVIRTNGFRTVISCTLEKVPHAKAEEIAAVVKQDEFDLTYTTPIAITEKFSCTKYSAKPKNTDPRQKNSLVTDNITWTISMTLESSGKAAESGDGL